MFSVLLTKPLAVSVQSVCCLLKSTHTCLNLINLIAIRLERYNCKGKIHQENIVRILEFTFVVESLGDFVKS